MSNALQIVLAWKTAELNTCTADRSEDKSA